MISHWTFTSIKKLGWQYSHILHNWTHSSVIHAHVRSTQWGIKILNEIFHDSNMKNNNKKKKLVPSLLFQKSWDPENWKQLIQNWVICLVNNLCFSWILKPPTWFQNTKMWDVTKNEKCYFSKVGGGGGRGAGPLLFDLGASSAKSLGFISGCMPPFIT